VAKKLFVGNLDFSTSENDLRDLFAQQGSVASADIVLDRMTGRSRGFGFVTYDSDEDAQRAIGALDGTDLNGRRISVSVARERGDSPGGGRSFGGQRGGRPGGGRGERR
jgi:cold-inducible RNA-binding protein